MTFWRDLERFDDAPCVEGVESLTYCEVARFADVLFTSGRRSVALLLCGRNAATLIGYLGCLRASIVPVMLPDDISQSALQGYIDYYQPRYIWHPAARQVEFEPFKGSVIGTRCQYELIDLGDSHIILHPDLALLLTTSGSTGDPKLVRLSAANLQANADAISRYLEIDSQSKPITLLPLHYSFGLSVINSHLNCGASIVFTNDGLTSRGFWEVFRQCEVTSFYGVPYHFEILKKLRFERMEFPNVALMAQAGGRMPDQLKQEFQALSKAKSFKFVCMYGQTEATARIAYLPPERFEEKSGSVGQAIPGGSLSISHPDQNGIGEVTYKGPNVCLGYATSGADLARGDENEGTLLTGDVGYLDDEGFLYLTGRKKRYIKVYGHSVNLDHLEGLIKEVAAASAVIGHENRILVLLESGDVNEVKQTLQSKTNIQPGALSIERVEALMYHASGKIDYNALADRYLKDE